MIGVLAVGIAALMMIASLSSSIENTLGENVYDILSSDITIVPDGETRDAMITDVESNILEIKEIEGVQESTPRIEAEGLISTGIGWRNTTGALVFGIDRDRDHLVTNLRDYIVAGSYASFRENSYEHPTIIVGSVFLRESNLWIEDGDGVVENHETVRLTFGKLREFEDQITPIVLDFVITASYESRIPYFDSLTVFIQIEQSRRLMDLNSLEPKANIILTRLHDRNDADDVREKVLASLSDQAGDKLIVRTHDEYKDRYLNDIVETTRPVGYLIISVSLASAVLRMVHSSATSVQERIYDIGILRAIGFTKRKVYKIYLLESAATGTLGGFLGIGFGYLIMYILQRSSLSLLSFPLAELELYPSPSFLMGLLAMAIGVGVISVLCLLLKTLRDPSVYLMRFQ